MTPGDAAVATAIALMHDNLSRPLRLHELADAAYLSPFHFERVFRSRAGVSPMAFASALRIEAAKRLIVTGDASVTDACYALGYGSFGSFVSRFTRSVGVPPGLLRAAVRRDDGAPVTREPEQRIRVAGGAHSLFGAVRGDMASDSVIWIGVFGRGVPDGPPLAGAVLDEPGPFRIDTLPPGAYNVFALGVPRATSLRGYLALGEEARVGKGGAVVIGPAGPARFVTITLAPPAPTDPPVLVALPLIGAGTARSK
jgi:AraC-like DNA-binding protein